MISSEKKWPDDTLLKLYIASYSTGRNNAFFSIIHIIRNDFPSWKHTLWRFEGENLKTFKNHQGVP